MRSMSPATTCAQHINHGIEVFAFKMNRRTAHFGISPISIQHWLQRITPCSTRNKPSTSIDMAALIEDCTQINDAFYYERAARLGVSPSTVFYAMKRLGLSHKKNATPSQRQR